MQADESQRIRKGWQGIGIPGSLPDRQRIHIEQLMGENGDERKESQQHGGWCAQ